MKPLKDHVEELKELEDWLIRSGPQKGDTRTLKQRYWAVLAQVPSWAEWSEEELEAWEEELETSFRDLLACARCTGECQSSLHDTHSSARHYYAPWAAKLIRERARWLSRCPDSPPPPTWPIAFAAHPCPGPAERKQQIRALLSTQDAPEKPQKALLSTRYGKNVTQYVSPEQMGF